MRLKLVLLLEICILQGSEAIGETQYQDFLASISSLSRSIYQLFNGVPELKELPDCGKRYVRQRNEAKLSECFWNCQWKRNPYYANPGIGGGGGIWTSFSEPLQNLLPDFLLAYLNQIAFITGTNWFFNVQPIFGPTGIVIGYENIKVDLFATLPLIPTDTACLQDCYTRTKTSFDSRIDICRLSLGETLLQNPTDDAIFTFFKCLELFNSQSYRYQDGTPIPAQTQVFSFAKDYLQMATEICLLAYIDPPINGLNVYTAAQRQGCFRAVTICAYCGTDTKSVRTRKRLFRQLKSISKEKKGNFKNLKTKRNRHLKNQTSEIDDILKGLYESSLIDHTPDSDTDRVVGASVFPVELNPIRNSQHHPWLCSLRTRGFRGRHRCGVTLLSGPTVDSPGDPFVLVGAAHCNYICKDRLTGDVLETCCCRPPENQASCVKSGDASPYCTGDPVFTLAEPRDLKIVCGEFDSGVEIIRNSFELEQVFNVKRIVNHPSYQPNREGIGQGGPIEGNDISVYHVETTFKLGMEVNGPLGLQSTRNHIWPVCLPKDDDEFTSNRGMIAGWLDSPPVNQVNRGQLGNAVGGEGVIRLGFYPRVSNLEVQAQCQDPKYMRDRGVDTYYPQGTVCYAEPSQASCADFGISGSGVVREWKVFQQGPGIDFPGNDPQYQYSFVGPLSMSKGCDRTISIIPNIATIPEFVYRGENPVVATDATCFMSWIAKEYGLKLPKDYAVKETCSKSTGDKTDINKDVCWTGQNTQCDWDLTERATGRAQCSVFSQEGIAYNVNRCIDTNGFFAPCNNNCRGVDPNSIIGAGVAAASALGIAGTALLGPVMGFGFGGLAGAGGSMLTRQSCPPTQCQVGNGCCDVLVVNGRGRCPASC